MEESNKNPILPIPGQRNIPVTSALPYVNNVPHLGNLTGSVLSADVFTRYCRARGVNTLYVCDPRIKEGIAPQELCDKYHSIHKDIYTWFNISFDVFGRTTTEQQTSITHDIYLKLLENGYLKEESTTQLFCPKQEHNSFLADRFVEGICPHCGYGGAHEDQCDVHGTAPVTKKTKHIFLELDKLQPQIEEFVAQSSSNGQCITRDMKWGTPVSTPPSLSGYEEKVIYAWFDACIGYISIIATYTEQWSKWWRDPDNVRLYQFLGKDNVAYHTVIFPGSLIGTEEKWTKLHHLSTTDYLTYEGEKFSKSRGAGVFGDSAKKTGISSDVWRYYLLPRRPESGDTELKWDAFLSAKNNILLKNLGNLVSRVVKFLNSKHYNGVVPNYSEYQDEDGLAVRLRSGLTTALATSQKGNAFLQSLNLSSKLAELNPVKCTAAIGFAANLLHLIAAMIEPYMPETAGGIIPDVRRADSIKPGHVVREAKYLFSNIKVEKAEEWRRKGKKEIAEGKTSTKEEDERMRSSRRDRVEKEKAVWK
ncbi:tRNA synthetases class I (M)-domain-containing protein [Aspergillus oleicola]